MNLTAEEQTRLEFVNQRIEQTRRELKGLRAEEPGSEEQQASRMLLFTALQKRLDCLGKEKGGLLGKMTKLGPGDLNKRDRLAMRRIKAGMTVPGTIPAKRLEKILKQEPGLIKTYVYSFYRSTEPSTCQCCPDGSVRDKKGFGHIFCHAIRTPDDKPADKMTALSDAIEAAGIRDGDEFEIIIRRTGLRPFGDRLLLSIPGVQGMVRQPDKEVEP